MIKLVKTIALSAALLFSVNASANLLSIELDGGGSYHVGDLVTANIFLSDIEKDDFDFRNILGGFEFVVEFDSDLLELTTANFGSSLLDSDQGVETTALGSFLSEVSFSFDDELYSAQADKFMLVSLSFVAKAAGSSLLGLSAIDLYDAWGLGFNDVDVQGGDFEVAGEPTAVPEPSVLLLLGTCLVMLVGFRARQ